MFWTIAVVYIVFQIWRSASPWRKVETFTWKEITGIEKGMKTECGKKIERDTSVDFVQVS